MGEPSPVVPPSERPPEDRLDSWKEIAAYLSRDVTTVQRWEKREGMPVHRHLHDRMGSVYASRAELDAWTRSRNPRAAQENENNGSSPRVAEEPTRPSPVTNSRWFLQRRVLLGLVLVLVALAAALRLGPRRTVSLPFATVKITRLTGDGHSVKASISPDGRYIAHTSLIAGQESLHVRRTTTLNDIEIVPPQAVRYIGVTFSPDSETIYYVLRTEKGEPASLYRIPVMGGSPEKLKALLDSPVTLSPNGKKFAFVRESAAESSLIVADLEAGGEESLISRKLPRVLDYPAWSPDGQIVAVTDTDSSAASPKGSGTRIVGVQVADRVEKALSAPVWGNVKQLSWLGNGRGLVLSARGQEESGTFHVWNVSYPEGVERRLTEGVDSQTGASVSADSSKIVTVQESSFSTSIWRVPATSSDVPNVIVPGLSGWSAPVWTRDDQIVFEEELDGRRTIWTVDTDGKNRKQLTLTGNNYDQSVSMDGHKLAWVSDRNGNPAIWTMDMDGGDLKMVVNSSVEAVPQLSPDGKWVTFTAIGSGHWKTLWIVPSEGGKAVELNDRLWYLPVISPDGKWIAGFFADQQLSTQKFPESIAVIGKNGEKLRKLLAIPLSVYLPAGIRWSPDGRELTYVNRGKDGDNIWSIRLGDVAPRQLTHFHEGNIFGFNWSPDGKQLCFSRGIQTRDVVLIEDTTQK